MSKAKLFSGILIVLLLSSVGTWGYWTYLAPEPEPAQAQPTQAALENGPKLVSAEGTVVPGESVRLGFKSPGVVETVFVQKGERVEAGTLLARLENKEQLAAAVAAAEMERVAAQQALDELHRQADLAAAQAAKAVADGRAAVRDAQRRVDNLGSPSEQTEIDKAYAAMLLAKDRRDKAREDFEPYQNKPENNLTRAALLNKKAQAEQDYDNLERRYNNLRGTANEIDLAQAEADLALAEASLADAQRELEQRQAGPDPEALALAETRLVNAQAQLSAAQAALADLELRAPLAGTVIRLDVKAGEYVTPGVPLILLADLSTWKVETTDLAEADVALLATGMPATISLDAFAGQSFAGEITEIDQFGEDRRGSITYTVTLTFDPAGTPVRWGMTAFVDITLR